jgi:spore maturation protein CgeB
MRLVKLGVYSPKYLEQFYSQNSGLEFEPYNVQHEALIDDCFGSSDFWTHALTDLGYQTTELIANAESMQKRWATEQGITVGEEWFNELVIAQLKHFRAEVLIVADYSTVTGELLKTVRTVCPTIRLILGWCGAPHNNHELFRECDSVLSCVPELVTQFQTNGLRCAHLDHAFDSRVLEKLDPTDTSVVPFSFVGSIVKASGFHNSREKLLSTLIAETPLEIWSDVAQKPDPSSPGVRTAGRTARSIIGSAYRMIRARDDSSVIDTGVDERIRQKANAPLFGVKMFERLRNSQVTLNTHIDISQHSASNMRLFEATGVGTCLLTDWKDNLVEMFEPETEVVSYRSAEECVEKVKYLLDHESERREIGAAGQRRALRDHTFADRAERLHSIIGSLLKR